MLRPRPASLPLLGIITSAAFLANTPYAAAQVTPLAQRVEIRRTAFGVPHVLAEDLAAAFFGLAYCQLEDYGERVVIGLLRARGELARYFGPDSLDSDFLTRRSYLEAQATYHLLDPDIRDVFEGFAAGVNHYVSLHPGEFPEWLRPDFTGHDVAARWTGGVRWGNVRRFLRRLREEDARSTGPSDADVGSNAWAFAPGRTRSRKAILLRNPHLSWDAGYYEAHLTVPGVLNFYGDFRIGYPLFYNGGFNDNLGWATTNNGPDLEEIYALDVDPDRPDHYLFDGGSVPLRQELLTLEFGNGAGLGRETRETWHTPLGPVIHRGGGKIYVVRAAGDGELRMAEQFLRMMQARNLEEWKAAMRLQAQTGSNFTYADRRGNIFYVWNAALPALPHISGGDTAAVPAARSSQVWTRYMPFDSLPQLLNPKGGYLQNANDPFHYTNLNAVMDSTRFAANLPGPALGLRSQHSLELVHSRRRLRLEDVVEMKHSMRMLLADRVKDDLVSAVRRSSPQPEVASAIELIERWDNSVAPESRGGVLFQIWFRRYLVEIASTEPTDGVWSAAFSRPWNAAEPTTTPRGLADPGRAVAAFDWAVEEAKRRHGDWGVAWGEVHRLRRGKVDVPVGGCPGQLGCFRVLWFEEAEDGKQVVTGGDGWVLAVEFGDPPRAYSILAYGESGREDSAHFADQAEMFARGQLKTVAFTESQIEAQLVRKYRPGAEGGARSSGS